MGESDPETEAVPDPSDWTVNIPEDLISRLSSSEKKRQDVFNGMYFYGSTFHLNSWTKTLYKISKYCL